MNQANPVFLKPFFGKLGSKAISSFSLLFSRCLVRQKVFYHFLELGYILTYHLLPTFEKFPHTASSRTNHRSFQKHCLMRCSAPTLLETRHCHNNARCFQKLEIISILKFP